MEKIVQNPELRKAGHIFLAASVTIFALSYLGLPREFGLVLLLMTPVGTFLVATGSNIELTPSGIKLGLTNLNFNELERVYEKGKSEIVLVAGSCKRHRIKG